jgi:hypothetical protein
MTEKRVDTHLVLKAFEIIRTQGQRESGEYGYEGFTASTDFDGYTIFIRDHQASITVFFHNKYEVKFEKAEHLDAFLKRLYALAQR